jgi:flavin-binding protein dodecin
MQKCVKIFKGLGILFLLCVLSSTMAFSEDKTKSMDNQTTITNMTQMNDSENRTAITNMKDVNPNENQTAITNTTKVNTSENITTSLNASKIIGVDSAASLNILTGTSTVSWEDAVQNVVNAVDSMGQQVKFIQVLKFDVKLENGKIINYEATVLLNY